VGERSLLLADEPSGALDSVNGEAVCEMILSACQGGVAAVVVTHGQARLVGRSRGVLARRQGRRRDVAPPSSEELLNRRPESGITMDASGFGPGRPSEEAFPRDAP